MPFACNLQGVTGPLAGVLTTHAYDALNRVTSVTHHDALGQRIRNANAAEDTVYHYDRERRLIAESTAAGVIQKEYIYLHDTPVAVLQ